MTLGTNHIYSTDSNGSLEILPTDPRIYELRAWVSAPGHVPVVLNWRQHEFVEPVLLYECLLEPGQTLQGVVQDESGLPVSDAVINLNETGVWVAQRQDIGFFKKLTQVTTDASGHFRSDQIPVLAGDHSRIRYSVTHPDFVRARAMLEGPESLATNHLVTLQHGWKMTGRVLGPDDLPVPNATVEENNHLGDPYREAKTDTEGRFEIGPFALGKVLLEAATEGLTGREQEVEVGPTANEVILRLTRKDGSKSEFERGVAAAQHVRLFGSAVDADSGEPLPRFQVWLDDHRGGMLGLVGDGTSGRFDWPVEMTFHDSFSLEVRAEGYESTLSDIRPAKDGAQHFEFRLRKGNIVWGQVVDVEGHPVAGAVVSLQGLGFGFTLRGKKATHSGGEIPQMVTRSDGRFSLPLKLNSEQVLVVHDSGVGILPVGRATNVPIMIQPWGSIEGVAFAAGRPAANQRILLHTVLPEKESDPSGIRIDSSTETDANGRFRFDAVPPVSVILRRMYNPNGSRLGRVGVGPGYRVDVQPGIPSEVKLETTGRAVVGRLHLSQPVPGYHWTDDLQTLEMERNDPPNPSLELNRLNETERVRSARLSVFRDQRTRRYFPRIESDGSFRIEDVPSGNYVFKLALRYPAEDFGNPYLQNPAQASGSLDLPIRVPDGSFSDSPVDLGVITIPIQTR
jgi:protocatechuate 3,4-dioxygenase beta subunit